MLLRTNSVLLDTVTLHCLLIITVLIVQLFSLTIATNNIQNRVGHMSKESKLKIISKIFQFYDFFTVYLVLQLPSISYICD